MLVANKAKLSIHLMGAFANQTTASTGMLLNLCVVLLQLTNKAKDKLRKILPTYCLAPHLAIKWDQEAKLHRLHSEGDDDDKMELEDSYGFTTQIFFLTHYAMHIGALSALDTFKQTGRLISNIRQRKKHLKAAQANAFNAMINTELQNLGLREQAAVRKQLTMEAILFQSHFIKSAVDFYEFTANFLLEMMNKNDKRLACMPEFIVQDLANFVSFMASAGRLNLVEDMSGIIKFMVRMMRPGFLHNPHLRSFGASTLLSLVNGKEEARLRQMAWQALTATSSAYVDKILSNAALTRELVTNLIHLYVDIEVTGRHNQFYDKFEVRRNVGILLRHVRKYKAYNNAWFALTEDSSASNLLLGFVDKLMNDCTYLLDECLIKLTKIREFEQLSYNQQQWAATNPQRRTELQMENHQHRQFVKIFAMFGNETLELFTYLLQIKLKTFKRKEIITRVTQMANYFLDRLVGKDRKSLLVADSKALKFKPRDIVHSLALLYISLNEQVDDLPSVVASDKRSYNKQTFMFAFSVLKKYNLLRPDQLKTFEAFLNRLGDGFVEEEIYEQDVPPEFIDSITLEIMRDPVRLPSSKQILDRATIERHLLSNQKDPFTREKLTVDMLIEEPEFKAKIESWLKQQRDKKAQVEHKTDDSVEVVHK